METKICIKCKEEKVLNDFVKKSKTEYRGICKKCNNIGRLEYVKEYNKKNKEKIKVIQSEYNKSNYARAQKKKYYELNKDTINENARLKHKENKEMGKFRTYNCDKEKERARKKIYNEVNKEKKLLSIKEWRKKHPEVYKERIRLYNEKNKDVIQLKRKEYREKNKEYLKRYYKNNKDNDEYKLKRRLYRENNRELINEKKRKYDKVRNDVDPLYKLKNKIKSLIRQSLKNKNFTKTSRTHEILGCSYDDFKSHIENQFEPWMNWGNVGKYEKDKFNIGWDIDHIIPISSATTESEIIKLNHYSNLRPLCSNINRYHKKHHLNWG